MDLRIFCFTAAVSVLAGILFGLAPILRSAQLDLTPALKQNTWIAPNVFLRGRWLNAENVMVVAQVALSVSLLVGAGLLVRSLGNLQSIDPGFNTRNLLMFGIDPTLNGYTETQTRALYNELQNRIAAIPGVMSASYSFDPLLSGNLWSTSFSVEEAGVEKRGQTDAFSVGPKFFETMHIPLRAGRSFELRDFAADTDAGVTPVVVNQTFVRQNFANENPLGRHVRGLRDEGTDSEIIGVVGDAKDQSLRREINAVVYVPQKKGSTTF
jgi:hypothetical protein